MAKTVPELSPNSPARDLSILFAESDNNTVNERRRRPFDTWNTIWNDHLEILEERWFYQIDNNADFFTEDRATYDAMRERQYQHWRNATLNQGITTQAISEAEKPNEKALQIALRFLKRRTGKSRIQIYGIDIAKRIPQTGRPEYTIIYNRRAYILH